MKFSTYFFMNFAHPTFQGVEWEFCTICHTPDIGFNSTFRFPATVIATCEERSRKQSRIICSIVPLYSGLLHCSFLTGRNDARPFCFFRFWNKFAKLLIFNEYCKQIGYFFILFLWLFVSITGCETFIRIQQTYFILYYFIK